MIASWGLCFVWQKQFRTPHAIGVSYWRRSFSCKDAKVTFHLLKVVFPLLVFKGSLLLLEYVLSFSPGDLSTWRLDFAAQEIDFSVLCGSPAHVGIQNRKVRDAMAALCSGIPRTCLTRRQAVCALHNLLVSRIA